MKRLNQARIESGYSIADVARLMQVSQATACKWLCGTVEPDAVQRRQLADLLSVAEHELDGREPAGTSNRLGRFRERLARAGYRPHHS